MQKFYTEAQVAACLHRERIWFMGWIRQNPTDPSGQPLCLQVGRTKRFTGDHVVLIIDLILTQEEAARPPAEGNGSIYFIDSGDHIKIGFSRSLDARVRGIATDAPNGAKLLHVEPGTFKTEKILHRHFAALRAHGEWFHKGQELLAYIEERKSMDCLPAPSGGAR